MKKITFLGLLLVFSIGTSQTNIKTMFYNVLNYPTAPPANREEILETIIDSYEPDIFMICELENEEGGDEILNKSLNDDSNHYSSAPFLSNFSNSDVELHQLLYYNNKKFDLLQSSRISNNIRDINWYTLEFKNEDPDADKIKLEIFVAHLKASQGTTNENKRLDMIEGFVENQILLDPDAYVIFSGDFNLYSSQEPAYQAILDANNRIVMVDPIDTPGNWNSNPAYAATHTQSTRNSSSEFGGFGSGGGIDSRFDFIMISENMVSDPAVKYVPNTYKSYGNNGNCYNSRIDNSNCTGIYDTSLRNALYQMSDHLPVVMELQLDANFLNTPDFDQNKSLITIDNTIVKETLALNLQNINSQVDFKIYNSLGQQVSSFSSNLQNTVEVSVEDLHNGLYYVTSTNNRTKALKFIKQN